MQSGDRLSRQSWKDAMLQWRLPSPWLSHRRDSTWSSWNFRLPFPEMCFSMEQERSFTMFHPENLQGTWNTSLCLTIGYPKSSSSGWPVDFVLKQWWRCWGSHWFFSETHGKMPIPAMKNSPRDARLPHQNSTVWRVSNSSRADQQWLETRDTIIWGVP